jgi:glycosyltransferase involved in cell wall biosynthesis
MTTPKLSVYLLTYNRPDLLKIALESILLQDCDDFAVTVLDNASTDHTPDVVASYARKDPRVHYSRNPHNIGIMRNWNRAFELNTSKYISVYHDDDVMLPGYLSATVKALDDHPTAGFVLTQAQYINQHGEITGVHDMGDLPEGLMRGLDLLELGVEARHVGMFPPTIVIRASALQGAGSLDSPHTKCQMDLNFYNRIAAQHDVVYLKQVLSQYRLHQGSETEKLKQGASVTGWFGENAERIDAATLLLESERAADPKYRRWLAEALRDLHTRQSAAIHMIAPTMYHTWETRAALVAENLQQIVPSGRTFILADDAQLGFPSDWNGRKVLPFLEHGGIFWGAPQDSDQAIAELLRMKDAGASAIIFAWPTFVWLDQYLRFHRFLKTRFATTFKSANLIAFDLTE